MLGLSIEVCLALYCAGPLLVEVDSILAALRGVVLCVHRRRAVVENIFCRSRDDIGGSGNSSV